MLLEIEQLSDLTTMGKNEFVLPSLDEILQTQASLVYSMF